MRAAPADGPGVCVPFETKALRAARVRPDKQHGLALLLVNFGSGASVYVLPWAAVPAAIPMTPRDKALHDAVSIEGCRAEGAITPGLVRRAIREVAASGAAGEAARAAELTRARREQAMTARSYAALLLSLLADERGDGAPLPLDLREGGEAVARAFAAVGARLGMPALALNDTLAQLARDLLPVGLKHDGHGGPLRTLSADLAELSDGLALRTVRAAPEARLHYARVIAPLSRTLADAQAELDAMDAGLARLPELLPGWGTRRVWLARRIERLDFLLDGWEPVLTAWTAGLDRPERGAAEQAAAELAAMIPPLAASRPADRR